MLSGMSRNNVNVANPLENAEGHNVSDNTNR